MPIYTYRAVRSDEGCELCREVFEVRQAMSDERLSACPDCGVAVQRIITSVPYVPGHRFGEKMTAERMRKGGLRKLVRDDSGNYVDDTPK